MATASNESSSPTYRRHGDTTRARGEEANRAGGSSHRPAPARFPNGSIAVYDPPCGRSDSGPVTVHSGDKHRVCHRGGRRNRPQTAARAAITSCCHCCRSAAPASGELAGGPVGHRPPPRLRRKRRRRHRLRGTRHGVRASCRHRAAGSAVSHRRAVVNIANPVLHKFLR